MIVATEVQLAVELVDAETAQDALDVACPGDFDVLTSNRTLMASASDPFTPAYAVAQGRVAQADYAVLASLALSAGIHHAVNSVWVDDGQGEVQQTPTPGDTLWVAMGIVPLEIP